ncbi:MAG: hypothetical protein AAGI17_00675 [Planctomycetota bacterium]
MRLAVLCMFVAAVLAGCQTTPQPPAQRPPDFAIGATVFPGPGSEGERYLVEPDGMLRAEFGGGVRPTDHPPRVRQLAAGEFNDLYTLALTTGLLDSTPSGRVNSPETFQPFENSVLVYYAYDGLRRYVEVTPEDERFGPLLERWRGWTWRR